MPYTSKKIKLQRGGQLDTLLKDSGQAFNPADYSEEKAAAIQERLDKGYTLHDATNLANDSAALHTILIGDEAEYDPNDREVFSVDIPGMREEIKAIESYNDGDQERWARAITAVEKIQNGGFAVARDSDGVYWIESVEDGKRHYAANAILEVKELFDEFGEPQKAVKEGSEDETEDETIPSADDPRDAESIEELIPEEYQGGFTKSDDFALYALGTDMASSLIGLGIKLPTAATGWGALIGGGVGLVGGLVATGFDAYSDYLNPEVTSNQLWGNIAMRLGFEGAEAVSAMPSFVARIGKAGKYAKLLRKGIYYGMAGKQISNLEGMEYLEILDRIQNDGFGSLELDDYRRLSSLAYFAMGAGSALNTRKKLRRGLDKTNAALNTKDRGVRKELVAEAANVGTKSPRAAATKMKQDLAGSATVKNRRGNLKAVNKAETDAALNDLYKTQRSANKDLLKARRANVKETSAIPSTAPDVGTGQPTKKPAKFRGRKPKNPVAEPGKDHKGAPNINDGKEYVRTPKQTQKAAADAKLKAKTTPIKKAKNKAEKEANKAVTKSKKSLDKANKDIDATIDKGAKEKRKLVSKANKKEKMKVVNKSMKDRTEKRDLYKKKAKDYQGEVGEKMAKKSEEKILGKKGKAEIVKKSAKQTTLEAEKKKLKAIRDNKPKKDASKKAKKAYKEKVAAQEVEVNKSEQAVADEAKKKKSLIGKTNSLVSKAAQKTKKGGKKVGSIADLIAYKITAPDGYSSKTSAKSVTSALRADTFEGREKSRITLKEEFTKRGFSEAEVKKMDIRKLRLAYRSMIEQEKKTGKTIEKKAPGGTFNPIYPYPTFLTNVVGKIVNWWNGPEPALVTPKGYELDENGRAILKPRPVATTKVTPRASVPIKELAVAPAIQVGERKKNLDNLVLTIGAAGAKAITDGEDGEGTPTPEEAAVIEKKYKDAIASVKQLDQNDPAWTENVHKILNYLKPSDFINTGQIFAEMPPREAYESPIVQTLGVDNMPGYDYAIGQSQLIPRVDSADAFASHIMAKKFHDQGMRTRNELVAKNAAFVENRRIQNLEGINRGQAMAVEAQNKNIAEENANMSAYTREYNTALAQKQAAEDKQFMNIVNRTTDFVSDTRRTSVLDNISRQYNQLANVSNIWQTEYRPRFDQAAATGNSAEIKKIKTEFINHTSYDPDDLNRQMLDLRSQAKSLTRR